MKMSRTFESMIYDRKERRINWYNLATIEAQNRFNKPYEALTPTELKELIQVLAGTVPYW
jgi:hypothetical protein